MSRRFKASLSQYFETTVNVLTAVPITFSCWFRSVSASAAQTFVATADSSGANYFTLMVNGATAGRLYIETGGGTHAETTVNYQAGKWHHACGVFGTASTGSVYLDGTNKVSFTGGATQAGINKTDIGVLNTGGLFSKMDGDIVDVAIWNVALDDYCVAALAAGISPKLLRPESLKSYWPLNGYSFIEQDRMGAAQMVRTGGAIAIDDMPVQLKRPTQPTWRRCLNAAATVADSYLPLDRAHQPQHQAIMAM